ncbi:MAG: carbon-phosphorus lyase complex subunit PhnI [Rhizobiales bacterium]|nr:carbon-phosphorus lyase complex subunit PhnI [Hyphomicrobiales bacterium]
MYVAVKGGQKAIDNAHRLFAKRRRGDAAVAELTVEQIAGQLKFAVDRVMAEGSLYDPELAAMAIKQAGGDLIEAIFLVRAFRTTLPRFGYGEPVDTAAMRLSRRVSAVFKDLPGGQLLGPTFDYSHRLIDFDRPDHGELPEPCEAAEPGAPAPRVTDVLGREGLLEPDAGLPGAEGDESQGEGREPAAIGDLTREPLSFPAGRDVRLQNLARGDEGFLLALAYSTQRGYARNHPFVGELRVGEVMIELTSDELGCAVPIGRVTLSECQTVNQFKGSAVAPPQFTRGYGLAFGQSERKALAMALVERALRAGELGEERTAPAQDEEFVLSHSDNIQATGFVEHLKLPHYVDFQAELDLIRRLAREHAAREAVRGEENNEVPEPPVVTAATSGTEAAE